MSDRDLLEAAAKAAGYTLVWGETYVVDGDMVDCTDMPYVRSNQADEADWYWSPLNDDGDALRLAVKLSIDIEHQCPGVEAYRSHNHESYEGGTFCASEDGSDPYAATRRAIVRAAAAMAPTAATTGEAEK